jgi:hypothetical protein
MKEKVLGVGAALVGIAFIFVGIKAGILDGALWTATKVDTREGSVFRGVWLVIAGLLCLSLSMRSLMRK